MINMILLAYRYMTVRRMRTALTTLAIVIGVGVLFASSSLIESINTNLLTISRLPGEPDLSLTRGDDGSFPADPALSAAARVKGVQAVSGVYRRSFAMTLPGDSGMSVPGSNAANAPVITLIGVDTQSASEVSNYPLTEGRFIKPGDRGVLIIPASLARLDNLHVGHGFPLLTPHGLRTFIVVGLLDDSGIPAPQIIVSLADAQSVFDAPDHITAVEVAIDAGADRDEIGSRLLEAFGGEYEIKTPPTSDPGLVETSLYFFGMMALFLAGFLIINTFRTAVVERTHDLANLRAIGAERKQITQVILVESTLQGVIGSLLGLGVGAGFALFLVDLVKNTRWFPGFDTLILRLSPAGALLGLGLGIGAALVGGYFPARAAGNVSPLAALRPSGQRERKVARWHLISGLVTLLAGIGLLILGGDSAILGGLVVLLAAVLLTPALVRPALAILFPLIARIFPRVGDLARANILRQPSRAAVVVNGLMVGFAVFTASAALIASLNHFFGWMYTSNYLSDIILMPLGGETLVANDGALGADPSVAEQLIALPDIAAVSRLRAIDWIVRGERTNMLGIDPKYAGKLRPLLLYEGDHDAVVDAMRAGRAIVINDNLASRFDLRIGDSMQVDTPLAGKQTYVVVGIGDDIDVRPDQPGLIMANQWLERDFGARRDLVLYIDLHEEADASTALGRIQDAVRDFPQFIVVELSAFQEGAIQRGQEGANFFYLMAVVVMVPALLGLLNTMAINVLERKREIGLLRAIGGDRIQVQRVLLAETFFLGLLGSLIGILVGLALGISFIQLWDKALTARAGLSVSVPVLVIVCGLAGGLILTMLVSLLPARHAARLDIVQALRYE